MAKRRENGTGSLVSKGKGKPWLAKWKYNGKVYYRSTGKIDRDDALKELAKFVKPYQEETKIEVLNNLVAKAKSAEELNAENTLNKLMLDEVMEKFENDLRTADVSKHSIGVYGGYWSSFEKFLKEKFPDVKDLRRVTVDMAKAYLEELKEDVGVEVYNYKLLFYKRIWKMYRKEFGLKDIWEEFEKRKVDKSGGRRELTSEELAKLFDEIQKDEQTTLLFAIGLYTGLRLGDCCNIKWENVDLAKREIVIIPEKVKRHMKSPLHIPLHRSLYVLLCSRKAVSENGDENAKTYVLPEWCYELGSGKKNGQRLNAIFAKCGIEVSKVVNGKRKIVTGFHSLRHTFVSLAINSGMNPMLVQKIVGHSTVNMTEHYFHQNFAVISEGISKMPSFVKMICDGEVIDVEAVETVSVNLDKDVCDQLMKMADGKDVNELLRNMLGLKKEVKAIGCTAEKAA